MNKSYFFSTIISVAMLVVVTGCVSFQPDVEETKIFDLGVVPQSVLSASQKNLTCNLRITSQVAKLNASSNMQYRLLFDNAQEVHFYSKSRWVTPPVQMLKEYFGGVIEVTNQSDFSTGCVTELNLQTFEQVFESPELSYAMIQAEVSTQPVQSIDSPAFSSNRKHIVIKIKSADQSAAGGVQAMLKAVTELKAKIQHP